MTGIKDVAREAGVSVSTVSYVLSGKRSISAKTTDKVMAAVERLGYTPDASARKMRGMRNHIFALSAPIRGDINQAKYNAYFLQTAWQAKNRGYDVLLLTGEDAVADIRRVTQSNLVDGVVLLDIALAKGLEFDQVIVPDVQQRSYPDETLARHRLYTAISRATRKVTLIANGKLTKLLG